MKDHNTTETKEQLLEKAHILRSRIADLEKSLGELKTQGEKGEGFEFIVNASREFVSVIDSDYRHVAVNNIYCAAHNKKKEEIIGGSVAEIWGDTIFQKIIKGHLDRCLLGAEVNYQASFKFAGIGVRNMDVTYYPYHTGDAVTHVVVVSRDITAEKKAEKELLSLKKAVETMQLGVTISDTEGRILYTNPAEANMHGYSVEELLNSEVRMLAPRELWKTGTPESLAEIKSWRRECVNLRKDGTVLPVQLMSDVVKSQTGEPIGVVTTCEDITERKRSEEQIRRQLERLKILRDIDSVILSSLDSKVTLNVLLNYLMAYLDVHAALIMTLHPLTLTLEYAGSRGFISGAIRDIRMKIGEGLAGRIALERSPVILPDLKAVQEESNRLLYFEEEKFTSYFGLPLISKGQIKGTLEIFHRPHKEPEPEWLDFVEALAAQAAIAIDNAGMFNDLHRTNIELVLAYDMTLAGWSRALDLRDKQTEGHSRRVTELAVSMTSAMGVSASEVVHMRRGALLHDIGKLGVPDNILLKETPLNEQEWEIMKMHPVYAYEMLFPINYLRPALDIPYCHHEKWDGSGYPRGLKGEEIPLAARIFTIADVWDALCSIRPYRPAYTREYALDYISKLGNKAFDPDVLKTFLSLQG